MEAIQPSGLFGRFKGFGKKLDKFKNRTKVDPENGEPKEEAKNDAGKTVEKVEEAKDTLKPPE